MTSFPLSDRYKQALDLAFDLHREQSRKGSQEIPYFAHLMSVSALVLENGGSEDQAIAALLHDAVEDQGGYETLKKIEGEFGKEVAQIVDGCTDSYKKPKLDWDLRKKTYLEKLKTESDDVKLVALADKVHNARAILCDLQEEGDSIWLRFNGGKARTVKYYQSLANIFDESPFPYLKKELRHLVEEMITIANLKETGV